MRVLLKVIAGVARGRTIEFTEPSRFLFGRAADAHISLPDDHYISRNHFLIEIVPPACRLMDLGSKNGTYVNRTRYGGEGRALREGTVQAEDGVQGVALNANDVIEVGQTRISVQLEGEETTPTILSPDCGTGAQQNGLVQAASPSDPLADLMLPGAPEIPGYRLIDEIGCGGMGLVYKAEQLRSGRTVAVKVLRGFLSDNERALRVFEREICINMQLVHPHIVAVLDHGCVGAVPFLVQEFVNGPDLNVFRTEQGGKLSLRTAVPLMVSILEGLAHAHAARVIVHLGAKGQRTFNGVVHRDLKPHNILLAKTASGWFPKIADFGLAKAYEAAGMTSMTLPREVGGTPFYWAREQITHYQHLRPPSDLFSAAALFYELLTDKPVRDGFSEMIACCKQRQRRPGLGDFMQVIAQNPIVPIRTREPAIPNTIAEVVDRALTEDEVPQELSPAEMEIHLAGVRYPNAAAFRDALVQAVAAAGLA